jgi:uncharacterized membrane protein
MHVHAIAFLRAVHILSASLWVGAAVLNALFLVPSIMAAGPAGGQVMRVMVQVRKLPVFMNTVSVLAMLSGLGLYWWDSGGFGLAWITSSTGLAFTIGGLLAIGTAGLGHVVMVPAARAIGALGATMAAAGGPPAPEQVAQMTALQGRLLRGTQVGATLLVLATILMAVARFL